MSVYPPPSQAAARAGLDPSMTGYRVTCLEQLLVRFEGSLEGRVVDAETSELVDESFELIGQLRQIFPNEWPDESVLAGEAEEG